VTGRRSGARGGSAGAAAPRPQRIAEIQIDPRSPHRCRVLVEGGGATRIATLEAERLGLAPGRPWGAAERRMLREIRISERARTLSLRLLATAPRTRAALDRHLLGRGVAARVRRALLEDLETDGWIDDRRLARDLLDRLLAEGPWGGGELRRRLVAAGVPRAIADETLRRRSAEIDDSATHRAWIARARGVRTEASIRATLRRRGLDALQIAAAMRPGVPRATVASKRRGAAAR
jgi:regulatory protein